MNNTSIPFQASKLPLSFRLDRRVPRVLGILLLLTLTAMIVHVGQGDYWIDPWETFKSILGLKTNHSETFFIINTLRLPRTLVAWLVGIGLAISGTITQAITRNPLADPSIIGINAGAALAAVILLIIFPSVSLTLVPVAAFLGGLIISILVYLLAWENGTSPVRLILIGVSFNLITSALTNLMITFGNINHVSQALVWLAGSVYGRSWEQVATLLPWTIILSIMAFLLSNELNTLHLGDNVAKSLGSRVEWQRGLLLLIAVALAGASIATAGAVGFIGLISPHLARQLVGVSHQGLLPTAAMIGGIIVVIADLLGRLLFAPIEIPCGLITAIIGTPYFIYLLITKR